MSALPTSAALPRPFGGGGGASARVVRYLLVSYPLDYLWALTLFGGAACTARLEQLVRAPESEAAAAPGDGQDEHRGSGARARHKVLMVYGDRDQFGKRAVSRCHPGLVDLSFRHHYLNARLTHPSTLPLGSPPPSIVASLQNVS